MCALGSSIGDSVAETIGVFAEPELLCKDVTEDDKACPVPTLPKLGDESIRMLLGAL